MKTLDEHNKDFLEEFNKLKEHKNGIACPKCGEEMIDSEPDIVFTTYPPKYKVKCPVCGYESYRF